MKKFLTLMLTALLSVVVFAATETTVYYTAPSTTIGSYTVKLNVNRQGDANNWMQYTMTLTDKTYNSNPIYTYTFTDLYNGLGALQFQLYDGDTWKSQEQPISSWTSESNYNGKMWVHGSSSWIDYSYDGAEPIPSFTFPAGTTIYYDFRTYNDGVNIFNSDWNNKWFDADAVDNIITCTLTADWSVAAGTDLFRSAANNNWQIVTCSTLPEEGHNMLVSTDGVNYTWGTYSGPAIEPTPAKIKLHINLAGPDDWADTEEFTLAANEETASLTIENIAAGNYQFGVKIDGSWTANGVSFTRDNNSAVVSDGSGNLKFNADVAGDYTFTWTYATNTLSITYPAPPAVINYETIYFVNVPEWAEPRLFIWGGTGVSVTWPGAEMTLESETVNGYELFSYTAAEGAYASCIFSNNGSSQSADLDWSAGKYYYNGTWYDDIASIPSGPVVVNYETIYFVNAADWTTPRVYLWGGTEGATSWPGEEMTLESETVNGHELYSYTAAEGAYASCIFSDNGNNQSADLTWTAGKYFYSGTWYDDIASIPAESVPTYTVAGVEAVFGTNWDPTNTANDMTLNAGVYEWSKANITLPAGNVTFKVVKDHAYANGEWPSSNYELAISEAGIYTITITFNPSTEVVAAEAEKMGNAEVENTAALTGDWDSWAIENMSLSAGKESASITKHFDAGDYDFKIVVNSSDYRSNGHWFHRDEWTEADGITSEGSNMSFTADIDGDYTFTWTFATNKIEITFPELTWTEVRSGLTAERYYTVCWPKKMLYVRGASVWSFAGKDASMAYLVKEEGALDAGIPYIIYAEGATFEAVLVGDDAAAGSNNGLYGTLDYMDASALNLAGATYMLKNNELRPIGTNNHLDANRAYVILENIQGEKPLNVPAHKVRGIPMQRDAATSIDELNASETPRKAVINGQLFILRGEKMYDATGRLVK